MTSRFWWRSVLLCVPLWLSGALAQADGLRCENKLLRAGDSKYDARALCGQPDAEEHRVEKRTVRHQVSVPCPDGARRRCSSTVEESVDVPIDIWTYDFGPQRFVQYVIFEFDKIVKIESGNYGHKRS
jgi:hypothetical protein